MYHEKLWTVFLMWYQESFLYTANDLWRNLSSFFSWQDLIHFTLLFLVFPTLRITVWNNTKLSEDFSSMVTSLICLRNFLISWCLSFNSVSITKLAIFFFSLYPPLLIDKLTFANVDIICSRNIIRF